MSPLWQLASLMEKTPRLPDAAGKPPASREAPADPEELKDALLGGGLESPAPSDTGQLRRDLSRALLQAGALASPHLAHGNPQRKRKLETDLGIDASGLLHAFDDDDDGGEERLMLRELLDGDSLGLPLPPHLRGGAKRSKAKAKEKGKPQRCRCDRSGCLKRYCVCFAAGNECVGGECKCKGCENDDSTEERRVKRAGAIAEMQKKKSNAFHARIGGTGTEAVHLTGCNCKRSGCQRRYCECFQAGVKCTEKCRCCECKNPAGRNPIDRPMPPAASALAKGGPSSPGGTVTCLVGGGAISPGGQRLSPGKEIGRAHV